eukprot:scaffold1299_cov385-Pavlova_lutheri.AAC.23
MLISAKGWLAALASILRSVQTSSTRSSNPASSSSHGLQHNWMCKYNCSISIGCHVPMETKRPTFRAKTRPSLVSLLIARILAIVVEEGVPYHRTLFRGENPNTCLGPKIVGNSVDLGTMHECMAPASSSCCRCWMVATPLDGH